MKRYLVLLCILAPLLTLISCAGSKTQLGKLATNTSALSDSQFAAWNDAVLSNIAVIKLIRQSDKMIKHQQWSDAEVKLERTLRIAGSYAGAWSRLSWLSLRAARFNKAVQLAHRSNSYTSATDLKQLNWSFIRDAYRLMGNNEQMEVANTMLQELKDKVHE